jgi:LPXTG-motif cell wall-anchored protein
MSSTTARHLRSPALLALAVALFLALAPAASAESYVPPPSKATVSGSPKAGGTLTISGVTKPHAAVVVTLDRQSGDFAPASAGGQVLGSTVAGADGAYSLSITLPANLTAGWWMLTVSADGEVLSTMAVEGDAAATDTAVGQDVVADAEPRALDAATGSLPVTGSTTSLLLLVGVGLIAAGGATTALVRRQGAPVAV